MQVGFSCLDGLLTCALLGKLVRRRVEGNAAHADQLTSVLGVVPARANRF